MRHNRVTEQLALARDIYSACAAVSGISGSQRRQRTEKRRAGVNCDAARLRRRRNAVGDDVQHLVVSDTWRLELPCVASVVHAVLVAAQGGRV
jgi:hypothetical protein